MSRFRIGFSHATQLAIEALWTRVVHDLHARQELGRFASVAALPGLPRALAHMMSEARLEGVPKQKLDRDLTRARGAAGVVDRQNRPGRGPRT